MQSQLLAWLKRRLILTEENSDNDSVRICGLCSQASLLWILLFVLAIFFHEY